MAGLAYNVAQTQIGLGLEAVRGTAAASLLWMGVKSPKYKPDRSTLPDETLQGSMVEVYDLIPGPRYDSHGWDGYPYLDSFPIYLAALLGSSDTKTTAPSSTTLAALAAAGATTVSCTATIASGSWIVLDTGAIQETHLTTAVSGSGPFTVTLAVPLSFGHASSSTVTGLTKHQWSLLNNSASTGNEPGSCTIDDFDGEEWRQLTACQLDKLTIKGNASGLIEYTVSWLGNPSITPSTPTASYSTTTHAIPGWTTATIIGASQLGYVEEWEFDFSRGVKPVPGITGTQNYFEYQANALQASGKMTVIEQSGAPELTAYLAGTKEIFDFTFYDYYSGYACNLHSTKAQFKTGSLERGATGEVKAQLDFQCLPTSTDALAGGVSPVIATVANATTTTYAGS